MQYNGQRKKDKKTNDDPHNITHETKDQVSRTPLKPLVNSGVPEG
jgi:hypothetical protein